MIMPLITHKMVDVATGLVNGGDAGKEAE